MTPFIAGKPLAITLWTPIATGSSHRTTASRAVPSVLEKVKTSIRGGEEENGRVRAAQAQGECRPFPSLSLYADEFL